MKVRRTLLNSFVAELLPVGLLDRFQLAGVIVRWWNTNQYDLRTLVAHGFTGVVDGWVTTITNALEDKDSKVDPLDHKLVLELLPSYLNDLEALAARRAELDARIKSTGASTDEDGETDEDIEISPAELNALKRDMAVIKKQERSSLQEFSVQLGKARAELTATQERKLVLRLAKNDLTDHLDGYVTAQRQRIVAAVENWWDKYSFSLSQIDTERDNVVARLANYFKDMGYE